jgi:hypothetical protein
MLAGTVCLVLTLYKYVKTRRLVAGSEDRGGWWASGGSKGRRAPDIGTQGTAQSSLTAESRGSIYDRALITRFTIGFFILLYYNSIILSFGFLLLTGGAESSRPPSLFLISSNAVATHL